MKGYFNNLVATRVMDVTDSRVKTGARRVRRTAE